MAENSPTLSDLNLPESHIVKDIEASIRQDLMSGNGLSAENRDLANDRLGADEQMRVARRLGQESIQMDNTKLDELQAQKTELREDLAAAKRTESDKLRRVGVAEQYVAEDEQTEQGIKANEQAIQREIDALQGRIDYRRARIQAIKNRMGFIGRAKDKLLRAIGVKKETQDEEALRNYDQERIADYMRDLEEPGRSPEDVRRMATEQYLSKEVKLENPDFVRDETAKLRTKLQEATREIADIERQKGQSILNVQRARQIFEQAQADRGAAETAAASQGAEVDQKIQAASQDLEGRQRVLESVEDTEDKYWKGLQTEFKGQFSDEEWSKLEAEKKTNEAAGAQAVAEGFTIGEGRPLGPISESQGFGQEPRELANGLLSDEDGLRPTDEVIADFVGVAEARANRLKDLAAIAGQTEIRRSDMLKVLNTELEAEFNDKLAAHAEEVYKAFGILDSDSLSLRLSILREDDKLEALEKKRDAGDKTAASELKRLRKLAEKRVDTFMKKRYALIDEADRVCAEWANRTLYPEVLKARAQKVFSSEATLQLLEGMDPAEQKLILTQKYALELSATETALENLSKWKKLAADNGSVVEKLAEELVYREELSGDAKQRIDELQNTVDAQQQVVNALVKRRKELSESTETNASARRVTKKQKELAQVTLNLDAAKTELGGMKKELSDAQAKLSEVEQFNTRATAEVYSTYLPVEARAAIGQDGVVFSASQENTSIAEIYDAVMGSRTSSAEQPETMLTRYDGVLKGLPSSIEAAIEKKRKQREIERGTSAESAQERAAFEARAEKVREGREQGDRGFEEAYDVLSNMDQQDLVRLFQEDPDTVKWLTSDRERKLAEYFGSITEINDAEQRVKLERVLSALNDVLDPNDVQARYIRNLLSGIRLTA
ncbi:MAG TPA: hypothetical protein VFG51_01070 [Candidatus Saccharimonadia bacterium]|nr:hypothetical protein [Candidatus Saccharimonadia bacterium]